MADREIQYTSTTTVTFGQTVRSGAGSFQHLAPDLTLGAAVGSDLPDTDFLAPVMGNVLDNGAPLTKTGNYLGGGIFHYTIAGAKGTDMPAGAVLAGIGDGVTEADGAVVAYIDGDSAQTKANAAFKIKHNNSTPGSGFDWVIDGYDAAHDGFSAAAPLKGFARIGVDAGALPCGIFFGVATDDAGIVAQVGADNTIADGSLYISIVAGAGKLFQKQNNVWVDLQA